MIKHKSQIAVGQKYRSLDPAFSHAVYLGVGSRDPYGHFEGIDLVVISDCESYGCFVTNNYASPIWEQGFEEIP